jgi:hypothetical protein
MALVGALATGHRLARMFTVRSHTNMEAKAMLIRTAAILLGVGLVLFGVVSADWGLSAEFKHNLIASGRILLGVFFLAYGITGRFRFFRNRKKPEQG